MEKEFDVIYKDETMYGFIDDIVRALKYEIELALENEDLNTDLVEALEEAIELRDNNDGNTKFYKVEYNPMGAYEFSELFDEDDE